MKKAGNNSYSSMPANQPTANSLQANTLGEFAGTSHSQSLYAKEKKGTKLPEKLYLELELKN